MSPGVAALTIPGGPVKMELRSLVAERRYGHENAAGF